MDLSHIYLAVHLGQKIYEHFFLSGTLCKAFCYYVAAKEAVELALLWRESLSICIASAFPKIIMGSLGLGLGLLDR